MVKRTVVMKFLKSLFINYNKQLRVLALLTIVVLCGVGLLSNSNSSLFQRFLGGISPFLAIVLSSVLGFLTLSFLLSKGLFAIYKKYPLKRMLHYSGVTLLFTSIAILVDLSIVYPTDMNIPFPESLLFYPVIAFLVEMVFHVLPLSVLLFTAMSIFKKIPYAKLLWICILIIAMLEPTYQVIFMVSYPTWSMATVWINLFLFNSIQLMAFKNFGFMSMYTLRLLYYLVWHILWGSLRLQLIFSS